MKKRGEQGFTLVELLVVIAIIMVLAGIGCLFYFRNLDRPKATINAANLRAARSLLEAELLTDPDHPEAVLERVLRDAPGAVGMDGPGISIPDGTPMTGVIGENGVDTFYDGYNAEDFDNLFSGGEVAQTPSQETQESIEAPTQPARCAAANCISTDLVGEGYCAEHQIKYCRRFVKSGDNLMLCGEAYRDYCREAHYKIGPCTCTAKGSKNGDCRNCGHPHYDAACDYPEAIIPDNDI